MENVLTNCRVGTGWGFK